MHLLLQQGQSTSVAERVLRVTWLVPLIGAVVSAAVCLLVLWRSAAQNGGLEYQQAVIAHGESNMEYQGLCIDLLQADDRQDAQWPPHLQSPLLLLTGHHRVASNWLLCRCCSTA